MAWTTNETLLNYNQYTPCKAIFQGACDEIGKYYAQKGFKYTPSRPKLSIEKNRVKLEIAFFSSRTNTTGRWVTLEIIPTISAKIAVTAENPNGFLCDIMNLFYEKLVSF